MKGRLYFATKAQKEGKIMIKTHPCAQIFCCDFCGFEQVQYFMLKNKTKTISLFLLHCYRLTTGWRCDSNLGFQN